MKCLKPMVHNPQFEGKHHCTQCELELTTILTKMSGEEE